MLPSINPHSRALNGLVVDLFAGGGTFEELAQPLGRDPDFAINHDPEALGAGRIFFSISSTSSVMGTTRLPVLAFYQDAAIAKVKMLTAQPQHLPFNRANQ